MILLSQDKEIKEALIKRLTELGMLSKSGEVYYYKQVIKDAHERGMTSITYPKFSRFLSGKGVGLRNDEVLWLCARYCVFVSNEIVVFLLKGKLVAYPETYTDEKALLNLREFNWLKNQ